MSDGCKDCQGGCGGGAAPKSSRRGAMFMIGAGLMGIGTVVAGIPLVGALVAPAWAQDQRGSIEGVVKDASGAVLPGATVEADANGRVTSTVTDSVGVYRFPSLAPGIYRVSANLQGFVAIRGLNNRMVFMPEHFRGDQPYGRVVVDDYDNGHA